MLVLYFSEYQAPSLELAKCLKSDAALIQRHTFPDGESSLTLPPALYGDIVICQTLDHPNAKLVELILAATTARRLGAERVFLVAPYLCYMRQDMEFVPGQAVSQTIIGHMLSEYFDGVFTVDAHLHRIDRLEQAIPNGIACNLTASITIAEFVAQQRVRPVLIGPDEESEQWVATAAKAKGLDYAVATKVRRGDNDVTVELPQCDVKDRAVVIIDDIVSSGHTALEAAKIAFTRGASSVDIACTHALLAGNARQMITDAGVEHIWSCDTVRDESNAIHIAELIAEAIKNAL